MISPPRRSARARKALVFLAALATGASAACNAILGNEERELEQPVELPDSSRVDSLTPDGSGDTGPGDANAPDDGNVGPVTIVVPLTGWRTPNGAIFTQTDGGLQITSFTNPYGHAVIVPTTQPSIPSEDYTVEAIVRAPTSAEFGVLARVQADGSSGLLSSKFGSESKPFLGHMSASDWSPVLLNMGAPYTFVANARWALKVQVRAEQVQAKMWNTSQTEPGGFQMIGNLPWKTGKGCGYYIYGAYDAVLESMKITVP